ncbi:unnamed protein product [Phytophthora fragariaefolia]|uniref:Unnamed protein product n=1 Tax=Phytophthora fragariaefolia TaxID=1490495 RepID=A0A9W6TTI1_9STRA|nr:unnamed protein product [Phytophthora fragariaefolia]
MMLRVGDVADTRERAAGEWLGRVLAAVGAQLAALGDHDVLQLQDAKLPNARAAAQRSGGARQQRPAGSPRASSSSSSSSDASSSSSSSDSSASDSSNSSGDSEDEAPPPANGGSGRGNGGDDQKNGKDDQKNGKDDDAEEDDGNSSDSSSSSDSSAEDGSDQEEDDGVLIDKDDEKDKLLNGVDSTDEDVSGESDGSSDLENSYPRLPPAPVDKLIAFRQQAAQKELQMTVTLKDVVADARQRQQERRGQAQRSKRKKKASQSKRQQSKQSDTLAIGSSHLERHNTNGSTGTVDVKVAAQEQDATEDEWMVDCSCGLKEKNYDDGTSMIQCDSCSHWVHAKCADKQPEAVAQEKFLCFRCGWMFDCVCSIRQKPNHDDGQRMVECESCKTWQHTMCVARSVETLTTPIRAHRSRRAEANASPKVERKTPHGQVPPPPPVPAVSPPSSPPPPPLMPPPPSIVAARALSRASKHDRIDERAKKSGESERECTSGSNSSSRRGRGQSLGTSPSPSTKTHTRADSDEIERQAPLPATVTPSPRGKGLMLRGYSPASARTDAPSSRSVDVRSPLPLSPPSGGASSGRSYSSHHSQGIHDRGGRKRKTSSARDRLAKKLKIKKSSKR